MRLSVTELVDELCKHNIFICASTIYNMIAKVQILPNKDHRNRYVFPDGEATIERIKGLYSGTIKPEEDDDRN